VLRSSESITLLVSIAVLLRRDALYRTLVLVWPSVSFFPSKPRIASLETFRSQKQQAKLLPTKYTTHLRPRYPFLLPKLVVVQDPAGPKDQYETTKDPMWAQRLGPDDQKRVVWNNNNMQEGNGPL